jgi:hypothetical protein
MIVEGRCCCCSPTPIQTTHAVFSFSSQSQNYIQTSHDSAKITKKCKLRFILFSQNKSFYRDFHGIVFFSFFNLALGLGYNTGVMLHINNIIITLQPLTHSCIQCTSNIVIMSTHIDCIYLKDEDRRITLFLECLHILLICDWCGTHRPLTAPRT